MLITRTPLRISFAGGGSDLQDFYKDFPGQVLSTTINKYIYISIHPYFLKNITVLKYSQTEIVDDTEKISHRIFRQVLKDFNLNGVEITSTADIPAGTGLGSSSAFTVGLLNCIYAFRNMGVTKSKLAEEACEIEIDKLKEPIGKQDQYAASHGGLKYYTFNSNGEVEVEKVNVSDNILGKLEENLLMFYVGNVRSASQILANQKNNLSRKSCTSDVIKMTELAVQLKKAMEFNNLDRFGDILNDGWMLKKTLAGGITNELIDKYYNIAIKNGAAGGKLLGAGGGGFLLFYSEKENHERLRWALKDLNELKFTFENEGSKVIYNEG